MKYNKLSITNKICYAPRYEYYHPFLTVLEDFLNYFGFTEIFSFLEYQKCIPLLHWYRWVWTSMMKSDLIPCCSRCRHCSLMMLFHAHFFYKKLGTKTAELTIAKAEKTKLLSLFSTLLEVLLFSNMSTPHILHMG